MAGDALEQPTDPVDAAIPRPQLSELFARLVDQGETFILAEVRLYRAQATRKALSASVIAALLGGAIILSQALVVALLIGIMLALAPALGMGLSVAVVAFGTLATIILLAIVARSKIASLIKPEDPS